MYGTVYGDEDGVGKVKDNGKLAMLSPSRGRQLKSQKS